MRLRKGGFVSKLASANRGPKDVVVLAMIVPQLELRNVKRQVLAADFVESAHDPALEDAPEAFDRVRVDRADDVLALSVLTKSATSCGSNRGCGRAHRPPTEEQRG